MLQFFDGNATEHDACGLAAGVGVDDVNVM
jgi:hypothetical protein